jgi:hypothetical protein
VREKPQRENKQTTKESLISLLQIHSLLNEKKIHTERDRGPLLLLFHSLFLHTHTHIHTHTYTSLLHFYRVRKKERKKRTETNLHLSLSLSLCHTKQWTFVCLPF